MSDHPTRPHGHNLTARALSTLEYVGALLKRYSHAPDLAKAAVELERLRALIAQAGESTLAVFGRVDSGAVECPRCHGILIWPSSKHWNPRSRRIRCVPCNRWYHAGIVLTDAQRTAGPPADQLPNARQRVQLAASYALPDKAISARPSGTNAWRTGECTCPPSIWAEKMSECPVHGRGEE